MFYLVSEIIFRRTVNRSHARPSVRLARNIRARRIRNYSTRSLSSGHTTASPPPPLCTLVAHRPRAFCGIIIVQRHECTTHVYGSPRLLLFGDGYMQVVKQVKTARFTVAAHLARTFEDFEETPRQAGPLESYDPSVLNIDYKNFQTYRTFQTYRSRRRKRHGWIVILPTR